jgi:site-specific DNA-methyltransferase (adenine-specific)
MMNAKLYHGDCLEEHKHIEDGAVDLILCDLPFGTMHGINAEKYECFNGGEWDIAIQPSKVYAIANRVLRKNGKMVLFSQEPYTTELINAAIPNIPFSYRMIWLKEHFANSLLSKKAPVGFFEDILVFSKQHDNMYLHPLREYQYKVFEHIGLNVAQISKVTGTTTNSHYWTKGEQFSAISGKDYNIFIEHFGIDTMEGFMPFEELKSIDDEFKREYSSTFNLWQGGKYKSNVLEYRKDYDGYHPTQKPIALLEDLIQTYSNENDLIFDLTMGSGSTGVAARNTNRRFIGIEKNEEYFEIAQMRINKELKPPKRVHDENGFFQSSIFDFIE